MKKRIGQPERRQESEATIDVWEKEDEIREVTYAGVVEFTDAFFSEDFQCGDDIVPAYDKWLMEYKPSRNRVFEALDEYTHETTDFVREYYLNGGDKQLIEAIGDAIKDELRFGFESDFDAVPILFALNWIESRCVDEMPSEAYRELTERLPKNPKTFDEIFEVCYEVCEKYEL